MLIIFCFFYRINSTQTNDVSGLTCLPCKQNWRVDWQASHYYLFSWSLLHHRLIKTSMVIPEHNLTDHLLVLFLVIDNVIRIYTKKLFSCNCSQTGFQKKNNEEYVLTGIAFESIHYWKLQPENADRFPVVFFSDVKLQPKMFCLI